MPVRTLSSSRTERSYLKVFYLHTSLSTDSRQGECGPDLTQAWYQHLLASLLPVCQDLLSPSSVSDRQLVSLPGPASCLSALQLHNPTSEAAPSQFAAPVQECKWMSDCFQLMDTTNCLTSLDQPSCKDQSPNDKHVEAGFNSHNQILGDLQVLNKLQQDPYPLWRGTSLLCKIAQ